MLRRRTLSHVPGIPHMRVLLAKAAVYSTQRSTTMSVLFVSDRLTMTSLTASYSESGFSARTQHCAESGCTAIVVSTQMVCMCVKFVSLAVTSTLTRTSRQLMCSGTHQAYRDAGITVLKCCTVYVTTECHLFFCIYASSLVLSHK